MSRRAPRCPDCPGAPAGVPLVHGLPSPDLFDAAERGGVVLGGCTMFEGPTPRWACPRCRNPLGWAAAPQSTGYEGPDGRTGSSDPTRAGHLRVGTWNLRGYPHPGSAKADAVVRWQEKLSADIWLLTEVHEHWGLGEGSWAVSPPREAARGEHQRWAGIQTRFRMTQIYDDLGDRPAAEESLCLARIHLPEGYRARTVLVACSVLPWGGARKYWPGLPEKYLNDQQVFVLGHHLARIDEAWDREEPILWGGDFNQELRNITPQRKAAGYRIAGTVDGIGRLRAAFEQFGLRPLTENSEHLHPEAPTIDHLAISAAFARGEATVHRPYYENGTLLSDHAAYTADVEF